MKNSEFPKLKKTLAFILTFAILLSAVITAAAVPATAASGVWDGTIADSYAGGTGTEADPYLIETPQQLARMVGYDVLTDYTADITNGSTGKYYKLTADIYLNDVAVSDWYTKSGLNEWYTGTESRFCGSFDGGGHTIRGLHFASDAGYAALFPIIDSWEDNRYFKNIRIADSYICGSSMAGAIAGRGYGNNNKTFYFQNCFVDDSVVINVANVGGTAPWCGGFVGFSSAGTETRFNFENCGVLATNKSGNPLKYGMLGLNLTWNASVNCSVINSFAYCEEWLGITTSGGIANSYKVSDLNSIKGSAAKETMPDLNWDSVWQISEDGYPTYVIPDDNIDGIVGEVWDGKVATGYAGGSGTETDPYIIETARQLAYLIKHDVIDAVGSTYGKYYKLAADIYLNNIQDADWRTNNPNGWYETASNQRFGGNFNGDGYTIYGLYYNGTKYAGLFPYIEMWFNDVTIENIVVSDAYLNTSADSIGTFAATLYGGNGHELAFKNCFVDDNVYVASTNTSASCIGGIIGYLKNVPTDKYTFIGCASLDDLRHGGGDWKSYSGIGVKYGSATYRIENCFTFTNLVIDQWGNKVDSIGSYSFGAQADLLNLIGEKALETMPDFDWENGAFAPTQNGYPRLKIVSQRMGDINGDDAADAQDIALLKKHLIGAEISYVTDFNSDKVTDIRDLIALKKTVSEFLGEDSLAPAGYSLVWNDEFKGRTIDNAKWRTNQPRMTAYDGVGNFDEGTVRSVGNGRLLMTAYKNPDTTKYNGRTYLTTNSITTENRMSFKYGYLEVKAKVPYKAGCWPSLWLRSPNATQTDLTGKDGYNMEVDIIEPFGYTDQNGTTIHETNKSNDSDHCQAAVGNYKFKNAENLANEYHIYGFLWTADEMKFFIDGECFAAYTKDTLARMGYKGDFDDTVNILFDNQLISSSSPVANEEKTNTIENNEGSLPAEYSVEYVRLYQKQGDVLVLETPADGQ